MADTIYDNIVKAPVVLTAVARLLGENTNDLGRLCTSQNINQWAKWKPVKFASPAPITKTNVINTRFGLEPQENTAAYKTINSSFRSNDATNDTVWNSVKEDNKIWKYNKPSGGASSPFRLTDFASPENYKVEWGYVHNTPPPIDNFQTMQLYKGTLQTLYQGDECQTTEGSKGGSDNYIWNTFTGSVVYSGCKVRFGDSTWENIGGADAHTIPFSQLLQSNKDGEYFRFCLAIRIPNEKSLHIICSRMTFYEVYAKNITDQNTFAQAIMPYLATNQYLCYLLSEAIGTAMTLEIEAIPLVISNVFPGVIPRTVGASQTDTKKQKWSCPKLSETSKVYSVPSNATGITIQIINNVNYTPNQIFAYTHFNVYPKFTGNYAYFSQASYDKVPVNGITIRVTQELYSATTLQYTISYSYVALENGKKVGKSGITTGSRTFSTAVQWKEGYELEIGVTQPGLTINRFEITIK